MAQYVIVIEGDGSANYETSGDDPSADLTPQLIVEVIRDVAFHYFPQLAPGGAGDSR